MEEKKGIFGGALGRMILPGIILQSVLIGGGYATGREIVEYGAKFGAMGWLHLWDLPWWLFCLLNSSAFIKCMISNRS